VTDIPASLVKDLRDRTGAGFMDSKRALAETGGDLEEAQKLLREKGMAQAGKRAGRETTEGIVLSTIAGQTGAMVAIGCETEPVARNEEFLAFAEQALEAVEASGPEATEGLEETRVGLVARLGENVVVRGATKLESRDDELLAEYVHPPANKIGVLLKARGENPVAARRLAMHISFANPRFVTRDDIPAEELVQEREIFEKQPDLQGKPEEVQAKMVEGMLAKRYFAETVLLEQTWVHDTSQTVGRALEQEGLDVVEFARFALAE
jgi:elongation factor Ts